MSFEERIERLTERHAALTQSVELLVVTVNHLAAENQKATEENRQRDIRLSQIMEAVGRLAHIAETHEQFLDRLEGHEE